MFDRQKAVNYAKTWAYKNNPVYYDFGSLGGDCTNFVSQCIYSGGIPMNYSVNGWYYRSLNDRAPAWTGVREFWDFGINNKSATGFKLTPCALNELDIADIIQLSNGARYYHTLIVTEVKKIERITYVYVSAHDNDAFNVPLSNYSFFNLRCGKVSE